MAANIAGAGFPLAVWNRSADKAAAFAETVDAAVVSTPRELAESSDVVIAMLADDDASSAVHFGADGIFAAEAGAGVVLVMGTHSPAHVDELRRGAGQARVVIDAPVSGSIAAATGRTLLVMAGADDDALSPVKPVLSAMAGDVIALGQPGAGVVMKLVVNMLIHGLNQTVAEALDLAEALGVSLQSAFGVIERSAAAAPMLGYRKGQYLDAEVNPVSFALSLAAKDVALAVELAGSAGVTLPQAQLNLEQLREAEAAGLGQQDMAMMVNYRRSLR